MIATLLPGLRHTRTPLTAGALWLLVVWLAGGDDLLPATGGNDLQDRVAELVDNAGTTLTVGAISFVALLIGGLIPVPKSLLLRAAIALRNRVRSTKRPAQLDMMHSIVSEVVLPLMQRVTWHDLMEEPESPPFLRRYAADVFEHTGIDPSPDQLARAEAEGRSVRPTLNDPVDYERMTFFIEQSVEREMPALVMQLQIDHETIYNEIDRERSESELRLAIFMPLTVLIALSAYLAGSWLILPLLVLPFLLVVQASVADQNAKLREQTALFHGIVSSPTIEYLNQFRSRTPQDSRAQARAAKMLDGEGPDGQN